MVRNFHSDTVFRICYSLSLSVYGGHYTVLGTVYTTCKRKFDEKFIFCNVFKIMDGITCSHTNGEVVGVI